MLFNKTPIRILIIDDDEDDFFITSEYIRSITGGEFRVDWCYDYHEALRHICESKYDIYFIDYRLGPKTGLELLRDAMRNNCEEPIIMFTGKGNQVIDRESMQAGAFDYLVKLELSSEKLERSIRYALERAASIKALKNNERKFRSIFEKSKDSVFLADEDLVFRDVNFATSELFEYEKEELLQLSLYKLLENRHDRVLLEQELAANGEVEDKELEFLTKNAERKTCILSLSKELNTDNEHYVQGILHDITALKKAEKANWQAEKLKAAGRLVRILAHEVRNPLNNISLSLEQLSSEIEGEEAKIRVEIIERNAKRINDLISELLNSSNPSDLALKKQILQTILDESILAALDRITLKKIKLKVSYPQEPAYVMADPDKLKIAFLNIIINAIEAMNEETGVLSISIHREKGFYSILIGDNGIGISEENLSKLFEPYFTSKKNGLGLGLAATLNILQSHSASVDVQSRTNEGTTFFIRLGMIGSPAV
jgi:PAS domain S-box-containing protein